MCIEHRMGRWGVVRAVLADLFFLLSSEKSKLPSLSRFKARQMDLPWLTQQEPSEHLEGSLRKIHYRS